MQQPASRRILRKVALDDFRHFTVDDGCNLGQIPGIDRYPDRSEMLHYAVVTLHGGADADYMRDHHEGHLRPRSIGAESLRFVGGKSLFDGVLSDEEERSWFRDALTNGSGLVVDTFTGASREWVPFLSDLGIDESRAVTTTRWYAVAQELDDKEFFRRLGRKLNCMARRRCGQLFPEHRFAGNRSQVLKKLKELRRRHQGVWLKRPDLESGVGTLLVTSSTPMSEVRRYLDKFLKRSGTIIIEAHVDGAEKIVASCQYYLPRRKNGKKPQLRFISRQYIWGSTHQGNGVAARGIDSLPSHWPEAVREAMVRRLQEITRPFVSWAWKRGYVGHLGFDFIAVWHGGMRFDLYLLECNARKTAGTYAESVRFQVESSGRMPGACVAMQNCYPMPHLRHWRQVVAELENASHPDGCGNLVMNPTTGEGVIVLNPRLLLNEHPKCLLVAVAPTIQAAERLLLAAVMRLQGWEPETELAENVRHAV